MSFDDVHENRQPMPTGDPVAVVPAELLERILADAAARTNLPRSSVRAVGAAARTWPDDALGCAEPETAYLQMVVDGYHVVVTTGADLLDYRTDDTRYFVLCEPHRLDLD